ncbi:tripartite tricarboxylate transporter permease [Bacillus sp. Marseille-P3661]|uniref:tripartite tricarboxylate transporter permease n=1 Tax=Bacillus sp. Marseille-P3661 TaxID=1936234 RepID=UPI000C859524|nr:tripartite tricarboxylate transporter permease [Bacillus sp. Marseille-P3661]
MVESIIQAWILAFDIEVLMFILIGAMLGLLVGVFPGLGGTFLLAVLLPFTYNLSLENAIGLLIGAQSVTATGGSISAILIGVPGTPTNLATVFDGYPMARKGLANQALAASLVSSVLGGLIGAICLAILIPFIAPVVLAFGPAEFFSLALIGLILLSSMGEENTLKSVVAGLLGILLSFVGLELSSGVTRYTFGFTYLLDGINMIPVFLGFFAIAEMLHLSFGKGSKINQNEDITVGKITLRNIMQVLKHKLLILRSALIGVFIGIIPGVGGELANVLSYGLATKSKKRNADDASFGKGRIEGVIAPESANNAKEGGALATTMLFGIPGSSSMAILIVALYILGITPGKEMVSTNLHITYLMVFVVVIANILAAAVAFGLSKYLAKITDIDISIIIPVIISVALFGGYMVHQNITDVFATALFGLIGFLFMKFGFSRITFVIGFVLGDIIEKNLLLAHSLYGSSMISRPITLILIMICILMIFYPYVKRFLPKWNK